MPIARGAWRRRFRPRRRGASVARDVMDDLLGRTAALASDFLATLPTRPVPGPVDAERLRRTLGGALPEDGEPAERVLERLARDVGEGVAATAGPRFFGYVVGGHLPAALAADWLVSTWDQNAGPWAGGPSVAIVEEIALAWIADLLGIPAASGAFVTGATTANFTALAVARDAQLAAHGWDVEARGLYGAPELTVIVGDGAHASIGAALQWLGLGRERVIRVPADAEGRMRLDAFEAALRAAPDGPLLVCAQAGHVDSGAFDPVGPIADAVRARGGWLHVDGAFGLWAAASPALRPLLRGVERADSWATDAHKWLNVPYDAGVVLTAHADAHRAAMAKSAPVLPRGALRHGADWTPEFSRRARAVPTWAALRSLGRAGVRALVERCCTLARRFADGLARDAGAEILNDVALNVVLASFGGDARTDEVLRRVQADGTCWTNATRWRGRAAVRFAISNASTAEEDVDLSVAAIARCAREA